MSPASLTPLLLLAALGLVAPLGCSEPELPPYVRLEGPAPRVESPAKAALVTFWASWCPPCVEELPSLRAFARSPPAGIAVVTFGEDEDDAAVRAFFGGAPPPELAWRPDADRSAAREYGVDALPEAFLVVRGRLVARFPGPRDWNSPGMRRLLEKLVR